MRIAGLLEGEVVPDEDGQIAALQDEIDDLQQQLSTAKADTAKTRLEVAAALSALRKQLVPLYRALQMVFGELNAVSPDDGRDSANPKISAVWHSWKTKMPGKPAEFIDILLQHGEMTAAQLRIAGRCASDTVYQTIYKLNKAGLLNKHGGRFSLKSL